jgi:ABC-type polysaccharide/polyol phosphate export permease
MLLTEKRPLFWLSLVALLIKRELKVRYKGSIIGYLWSMLNPLLTMSILGFVFSHIMRFKTDNYSLFLLVGVLGWNFFSQSISMGTASMVNNASLMKKVKVPCTIFPAASIGSCLVNFLLALVPFFIVSAVLAGGVTPTTALVPLFLLPYGIFIFGLALLLASLNVLYRDVQHLLEPLLSMVFYGTPIIYPMEALPENFRFIVGLNPLVYFIEALRNLMYAGELPSRMTILIMLGCAFLSFTLGSIVYAATKEKFIYRL